MTKARLRAYIDLKRERDALSEMLEELESIMYGAKTPKLTGMPGGTAQPGSEIERLAVKHAELLDSYRRKVDELATALDDIEKAITALQPRERTVIRLHYIQGLTWESVCYAMHYSWRQVHRIHAQALRSLEAQQEVSCMTNREKPMMAQDGIEWHT